MQEKEPIVLLTPHFRSFFPFHGPFPAPTEVSGKPPINFMLKDCGATFELVNPGGSFKSMWLRP